MSKRLDGRDVYQAKMKILRDLLKKKSIWRAPLKRLGDNPDIGITKAGNVALRSRLRKKLIVETDVPLSLFGVEK